MQAYAGTIPAATNTCYHQYRCISLPAVGDNLEQMEFLDDMFDDDDTKISTAQSTSPATSGQDRREVGEAVALPQQGASRTAADKKAQQRARNRMHAANCRLRKRMALELSQEKVCRLQSENALLRDALKESCDAFELLKHGLRKTFKEAGQKLIDDHRRHMDQRLAVLTRLEGVLGARGARSAACSAPSAAPELTSAPQQSAFAFSAPPGFDTFGSEISFAKC